MSGETINDVRPILIFFGSPTSGPSRRMEAFVDQVLQARRNHQTFRRRQGRHRRAARPGGALRRRRVPTIVVVDGARVARRIEGRVGVKELRDQLDDWLR